MIRVHRLHRGLAKLMLGHELPDELGATRVIGNQQEVHYSRLGEVVALSIVLAKQVDVCASVLPEVVDDGHALA
jgi:hypothetical protein